MWYNHKKWSDIHPSQQRKEKGEPMRYLDRQEEIQHRTGDVPLAYYRVDQKFSRYRMNVHWHQETEIIYVRKGRLRLYLDGSEAQMEVGDLTLIGSGVIHGGEPENCLYECIVFDSKAMLPNVDSVRRQLKPLQQNNIFLKNGEIESKAEFQYETERLFRICQEGILGRESELCGAMLSFLSGALRAGGCMDGVAGRSWQRAEQLKPALEYIEQHYAQHISLQTLAELTGFSPKYFCRYFRGIVHRSPIDYLNYYRVERAAAFLSENDMNVAEVAALCGYADSSAFIKQFRKYKGFTPKQYKLRMAENEPSAIKPAAE